MVGSISQNRRARDRKPRGQYRGSRVVHKILGITCSSMSSSGLFPIAYRSIPNAKLLTDKGFWYGMASGATVSSDADKRTSQCTRPIRCVWTLQPWEMDLHRPQRQHSKELAQLPERPDAVRPRVAAQALQLRSLALSKAYAKA